MGKRRGGDSCLEGRRCIVDFTKSRCERGRGSIYNLHGAFERQFGSESIALLVESMGSRRGSRGGFIRGLELKRGRLETMLGEHLGNLHVLVVGEQVTARG